ncbi:MAG: cobalamin biosynthesis protein CobD [Halanaerobiales bacterium]|nr:cobalamin biosynthesis protein CobD [Halanaerobiales bacterium]
MEKVIIIGMAVLLDWVFGDPYWLPHPIRGIGWLIKKIERGVTKLKINKRIQGVILWLGVIIITFYVSRLFLRMLELMHPVFYIVGQIVLLYTCLAAKCLEQESRKVMNQLEKGDLKEARKLLSYLVGRETDKLTKRSVIRATIETVAENIVDGVLSPLFYAFIGGVPLALTYKAVNTLDSMVGYKNEKYLELGWASARMDDWANFIPARVSAMLIPIAVFITKGDAISSFMIMLRDRKNHSSPNAGHPEAAVAGGLSIRLGGSNRYFGKIVEKATLGDRVKPVKEGMISQTNHIMYLTEILALVLFSIVYLIIY